MRVTVVERMDADLAMDFLQRERFLGDERHVDVRLGGHEEEVVGEAGVRFGKLKPREESRLRRFQANRERAVSIGRDFPRERRLEEIEMLRLVERVIVGGDGNTVLFERCVEDEIAKTRLLDGFLAIDCQDV